MSQIRYRYINDGIGDIIAEENTIDLSSKERYWIVITNHNYQWLYGFRQKKK